ERRGLLAGHRRARASGSGAVVHERAGCGTRDRVRVPGGGINALRLPALSIALRPEAAFGLGNARVAPAVAGSAGDSALSVVRGAPLHGLHGADVLLRGPAGPLAAGPGSEDSRGRGDPLASFADGPVDPGRSKCLDTYMPVWEYTSHGIRLRHPRRT